MPSSIYSVSLQCYSHLGFMLKIAMLLFLNSCCFVAYPASYPVNTDGSFLGIKPTTHLHLVLRLQMQGAVPPCPCMSSWYGA